MEEPTKEKLDVDALLIGKRVAFYGVDNDVFCIRPEDGERMAVEVLEDPCDGYRSYLGAVQKTSLDGHIFFQEPVTYLTGRAWEGADHDGYELVDDAGHVWLTFGTDNCDDYYPCFTFRYDPPKAATPSESNEP